MLRVLIVDDDPSVVDVITTMLDGHFEAVGVTQPMLALDLVAAGVVDVLVTDLMMPVMDGFGLIRRARLQDPELPVLVVSAYIEDADPNFRNLLLGHSTAALSKPISKSAIVDAVQKVAAERIAQRRISPS